MLKDKDFGHSPVQVLCQARHNIGATARAVIELEYRHGQIG